MVVQLELHLGLLYKAVMEVACWRCGVLFDPENSAGRCPDCGYNVRTLMARARATISSHFATLRRTPVYILKLMAAGGVSFWLPDTLWHAVRRSSFGGVDVLQLTILMPLTLWAMYRALKRRALAEPVYNVGLPMMLGVWLLGGFFISLGGLLGGGYAGRADFLRGAVYITLMGLVPPLTYILATYDGSLGALILVTLGSILFAVSGSRKRRRQN
jgi:DNA-directed RNA polymerase subunit RPC12/RpoP